MSDPVATRPALNIQEFAPEEIVAAPASVARGIVGDIPVEIHALLGTAKISVSQLMAVKAGALFKLDRRFGEPVALQVNGRTIGYGEIVSDERDNLVGIKMTSIEGVA